MSQNRKKKTHRGRKASSIETRRKIREVKKLGKAAEEMIRKNERLAAE